MCLLTKAEQYCNNWPSCHSVTKMCQMTSCLLDLNLPFAGLDALWKKTAPVCNSQHKSKVVVTWETELMEEAVTIHLEICGLFRVTETLFSVKTRFCWILNHATSTDVKSQSVWFGPDWSILTTIRWIPIKLCTHTCCPDVELSRFWRSSDFSSHPIMSLTKLLWVKRLDNYGMDGCEIWMRTFMSPSRWIEMTLVIPHLFILYRHQAEISMSPIFGFITCKTNDPSISLSCTLFYHCHLMIACQHSKLRYEHGKHYTC